MTLRAVSFGLLGYAWQSRLPGTDPGLLPGADGLDAPPHPGALSSPAYAPGGDGAEAVFGGAVTATTTGFGTEAERTVLDVAGPWNSVKNAAAAADGGADLAFLGFVHVDAAVGLSSEEGSAVEIVGAKRGNVATGGGADRIDIRFVDSEHWSTGFRVASGGGNDEVRLSPLDADAAARAGDATFASAAGGASFWGGWNPRPVAAWMDGGDGDDLLSAEGPVEARARGGAGADRIALGDEAGTAHGGAGDDSVAGGAGADLLLGDEGDDTVSGGGGADVVWGGEGRDGLAGGGGADTLAGGGGDDTLSGGAGAFDVAFYPGAAAGYEVTPSADGRTATVRDTDPSDGDGGTDALDNIERVEFADRTAELPAIGPGVRGFVFRAHMGGEADLGGRAMLWVTDGTPEGTRPVKDIETGRPSGSGGAYSPWMALGDGRALVFSGDGGAWAWTTDGTAAGTAPSEFPGRAGSAYWADNTGYDFGPVALGEDRVLLASFDESGTGVEFWATDGTAAGTAMVAGVGSASPRALAPLGDGRALFVTTGAGGDRIWATDGTAAGTAALADLPRTDNYSGRQYEFAALGDGRAVFRADDGVHGAELWATDGTAAGTAMVADLDPGTQWGHPASGHPAGLIPLGDGRALFVAGDGVNGRQLWDTDGTAAGTALVKTVEPDGTYVMPGDFAALGGGRAVFSAYDGVHGRELWVTDGTAAGTAMVKDLSPGMSYGSPAGFAALGGGRAVFSAYDGVHGRELWVTDGTAAGTAMVENINPGNDQNSSSWSPSWSGPQQLTPTGDGRALFSAEDGVHGRELWITDGTAAGTSLLMDLSPGRYGSGDPHLFTPVVGGASGVDPFA